MADVAVKEGFSKRMIWIIIGVVIIAIAVGAYRWTEKIQYQRGYQEVSLQKIADSVFDMSERPIPYWTSVTSQEHAENNIKSLISDLPDIDFEKEMLVISYGAELESLKYNLKESIFKSRGKYIGFPYFRHEKSENLVFVYRAPLIPLMDTDVAGYPPDYKGKY